MVVDFENISLRPITEVDEQQLKLFSCGQRQLDEFLHHDAHSYHLHGLTSTVVVFDPNRKSPVAYFSLTADSVHLSGVERTDLGLPFDAPISYFPAMKLTKLAVCHTLQSCGLGQHLMNLICGIAYEAPFAVRLITVDAVNQPPVIHFYQRVGFLESLTEHKERKAQRSRRTILMFKDLYQ
jgi:ribosomal protein S18 acetylase RimI-like enzyme